jgi:hypothetical protein
MRVHPRPFTAGFGPFPFSPFSPLAFLCALCVLCGEFLSVFIRVHPRPALGLGFSFPLQLRSFFLASPTLLSGDHLLTSGFRDSAFPSDRPSPPPFAPGSFSLSQATECCDGLPDTVQFRLHFLLLLFQFLQHPRDRRHGLSSEVSVGNCGNASVFYNRI